jgi:hypothetical protein
VSFQTTPAELPVGQLGFGAMRITGQGIWGPPRDESEAIALLRRVVDKGVTFIDTADSYGPGISETLIAKALSPHPAGLIVATKGGLTRPGADCWVAGARGSARAEPETATHPNRMGPRSMEWLAEQNKSSRIAVAPAPKFRMRDGEPSSTPSRARCASQRRCAGRQRVVVVTQLVKQIAHHGLTRRGNIDAENPRGVLAEDPVLHLGRQLRVTVLRGRGLADKLQQRAHGGPSRSLQRHLQTLAGEFEKGARSKGTPRTRKVRC